MSDPIAISFASYLSKDIEALSSFYAEVFDLAEVVELRSEIFRGLHVGAMTLGFSAHEAYELLNLQGRENPTGTSQYITFETESAERVDELTELAMSKGAELLHEPYDTYYNAHQSVLADPEGNVFRINHLMV